MDHPLVKFLPGTAYAGFEEIFLPVMYIASGVALGPDGLCAFCKGDPCNDHSPADSPIARYFAAAPHAAVCPFCDGRPS